MGGLFSSPKTVKPPAPTPAPPVPTVDTDTVESQARRTRPRGRRETFLTGDLIPETTKKTVLG